MRSLQRGLALRKCEMKMNGASDQTAAVIDKSGQSSSRSFASLVYLFCFLPATVWSESWSLLKNKTQYAGEKQVRSVRLCFSNITTLSLHSFSRHLAGWGFEACCSVCRHSLPRSTPRCQGQTTCCAV